MAKDIEVFLIVQISVRLLGSHFHLRQVLDCCLGQLLCQIINDLLGDCAVELKFKEASVGTAFARCALTVAIVNKNFHR